MLEVKIVHDGEKIVHALPVKIVHQLLLLSFLRFFSSLFKNDALKNRGGRR